MGRCRLLFWALSFLVGIPVLQAAGTDAIVGNSSMEFRMMSPDGGTCRWTESITVLTPSGANAADFLLHTDSFSSLSSFSAKIYSGDRLVRKVRLSDLSYTESSSSLADDSGFYYFSPSLPCPYRIEYEYTVSYRKGVAVFPTFAPVTVPRTALGQASCSVCVPSGTEVSWWSASSPEKIQDGKYDIYQWKFGPFPGFEHEDMMPDIREIVPVVYSCPQTFSYAGTGGSQKSWKDFGRWLSLLNDGSLQLDDAFVSELRSDVGGCRTVAEKVRVLYDRLRASTRYVSIQLGIGGYRPSPAEYVRTTGFGDCKSLSIFMQAMLKAVGVSSEYLVTNTDDIRLLPGYSSIGQMNHALLCVPDGKDTLWIECTAPSLPLGYRHSGIAGHQAVLVKPEGGEVTVIPAYPDSLRFFGHKVKVDLTAGGAAHCEVQRTVTEDFIEDYVSFMSKDADFRRRLLTSGLGFHPDNLTISSFEDNFGSLTDSSLLPQVKISYAVDTDTYAKVSGTRIFVPMNPFARILPWSRSERKSPVHIARGVTFRDTVIVRVPDGYVLEGAAECAPVTVPSGTFRASAEVSDDGKNVIAIQELKLIAGEYPAAEYPDFRRLAKAASDFYGSFFVLSLKKENMNQTDISIDK